MPRSYPVAARAVSASGIDIRLTPSRARSLGHEMPRSPGTSTSRKSSSPRRTTRVLMMRRGVDPASLGRCGEAVDRSVPGHGVLDPGRREGGHRGVLAGSSVWSSRPSVGGCTRDHPAARPDGVDSRALATLWNEIAPVGRDPADRGLPAVRLDRRGPDPAGVVRRCGAGPRPRGDPGPGRQPVGLVGRPGPGRPRRPAGAGHRQPPRLRAGRRTVRRAARRGLGPGRDRGAAGRGFRTGPAGRGRELRRRGGRAVRRRLRRLAADDRGVGRRPGSGPARRRRPDDGRPGWPRPASTPTRSVRIRLRCNGSGPSSSCTSSRAEVWSTWMRRSGVASSIWPHGRWRFDFDGEANHAGTTRLADRRDPMLRYAEAVLAARRAAEDRGALATFGKVRVEPNGVNAIPSRVTAWLDSPGGDQRAGPGCGAGPAGVGASGHRGVLDR